MNTSEEHPRKAFHWRGFCSLLLFCSGMVMLVSSAVLYASPQGRIAHWTGWSVLGLEKEEWSAVHMVCGLLVVLTSIFHIYFNWSLFLGYIKRKTESTLHLKREIALALLVSVAFVAGTILQWQPFHAIVQWNDDIKSYWAANSNATLVPHAEELTLIAFAEEIGMPLDEVVTTLEAAGFEVSDTSIQIKDLARQQGMTPNQLHAVLKPAPSGRGGGSGGGGGGAGRGLGGGGSSGGGGGELSSGGGGGGMGRLTVSQLCREHGVDLQQALQRLDAAGVSAQEGDTIRALADAAGLRPTAVTDIIRGPGD